MTWQPTHTDLSNNKKVCIVPCPYVKLKGLIRVQSTNDDLYWTRLSNLKPIYSNILADPCVPYEFVGVDGTGYVNTPAPQPESPHTKALKAILEITGNKQHRTWTDLSRIDNIARKALTSGA